MTDAEEPLDPRLGAVLGELLDRAHRVRPDQLVVLVQEAGVALGATDVRVWLADHEQRTLVHLSDDLPLPAIPIEGTAGGRTFTSSEPVESTTHGEVHAWIPLLDGVDRIGVLEIRVPGLDDRGRASFRHLASVVTAELITRGQYTDAFTALRRRKRMTLAAEIQWQSLPPASFTTDDVAVAGLLEPAYDVGGDTFDYAHAHNRLDVAVLDAVGHDLSSAIICSLALATYRNGRRTGLGLREVAEAMDVTMRSQLAPGSFATGQVGSLDTEAGVLHWLNAGHPVPLLIRDGHVSTLSCQPRPPFGWGHLKPGMVWEVASEQLQPGDGVLFYTDGVTEARRPGGEDFGEARLKDFLHQAFASGTAPHEVLRRLSHAIVDFHGGVLRDDATTLLVVWQPDA